MDEVKKRQECLRSLFRGSAIELRMHDPMMSLVETVLCRGDRRMAAAVEAAYRKGARMDAWGDQFDPDLWVEAFDQAGVDVDAACRAFPVDAPLPWEHVDVGVDRGFLTRERERGLAGRTSPPCEKPARWTGDDDYLNKNAVVCHACGLPCDTKGILEDRRQAVMEVRSIELPEPITTEPEEARRVHLVFTKLDTAAFLSGLDLVRHIPRALRRAGIRLRYTKGFHPRPKLSARAPLGVGFRSIGEWMDAWVFGRIPTTEELNQVGLHGVRFLAVEAVPPNTKPHPGQTDSYLVVLPERIEPVESMGYNIEHVTDELNGQHLYKVTRHPWKGDRPSIEKWVAGLAGMDLTRYNFIRLYDAPYGDRFGIRIEDVEDIGDLFGVDTGAADCCSGGSHILGTLA